MNSFLAFRVTLHALGFAAFCFTRQCRDSALCLKRIARSRLCLNFSCWREAFGAPAHSKRHYAAAALTCLRSVGSVRFTARKYDIVVSMSAWPSSF